MPFTFSHPAIVFPIAYFPKKYYSLTGLIVGTVTPDFEYFLRMKVDSDYSHTVAGMFWFDLPLGLILSFIFHEIIRDPLISNLPQWFGRRSGGLLNFPWRKYFFKNWFVVLFSLLIGIASHLFWDAFTHSNGFFVEHFSLPAKNISVAGITFSVYHILQHASSLLGAAIIFFVIKKIPGNNNYSASPKVVYWLISICIMLIVVGVGYLCGQNYFLYGQLIITGISGGLIGIIISSLFSNRIFRKK